MGCIYGRGDAIVKGRGESFPVGLLEVVAAAERVLRRGDRGVDRNPMRAVGNTVQRPRTERAHHGTDRPAAQHPSPPAHAYPPTLSQLFHVNIPASPA